MSAILAFKNIVQILQYQKKSVQDEKIDRGHMTGPWNIL